MADFIQFTEECGNAPYNMALDEAMLDYAATGRTSARWYGWTETSASFGYSQKWAEVSSRSGFEGFNFVRRITGGGIVDHRNDQTYALALPSNHPLAKCRAVEIYKVIHESIATSLSEHGFGAELQACERNCINRIATNGQSRASACFEKAEPFDVIQQVTGLKLAGAAMKRDKRGLLVQGSLDGDLAPAPAWLGMKIAIVRRIASDTGLGVGIEQPLSALHTLAQKHVEKYSSENWNRMR